MADSVWQELAERCLQWAAQVAEAEMPDGVPALSPQQIAAQRRQADLLSYGFPLKYARGCDPAVGLQSHQHEDRLQEWMAALPEHLRNGGHLVLCGGVGIGKTMSCARIADFLRDLPGGRPWYPWEISFRFAPDLADELLAWDARAGSWPASVVMIMKSVVLFVDDVDRWLTLDQYDRQRQRLLYQWDSLMERRDSPGRVTVATANRPEWPVRGKPNSGLRDVPEFRRWLSRVHERGTVLEIPGSDRRAK